MCLAAIANQSSLHPRLLQPLQKSTPAVKILPNLTGVRTDDQFDEFLGRHKTETVSVWLPEERAQSMQCSTSCNTCLLCFFTFAAPLPAAQAVVNFGSSWCAHCHKMFPHFLSLTHVFPQLKYAVAQVDYMTEAPRGIVYTPTFAVFRRGRKVDQFFGANEQQLRDHLWLHAD